MNLLIEIALGLKGCVCCGCKEVGSKKVSEMKSYPIYTIFREFCSETKPPPTKKGQE